VTDISLMVQIAKLICEINPKSKIRNRMIDNAQTPLVSIGLPVFNGDKYLKEAIDSILAQTFRDFELIISDNASGDRTEEICRQYAAQDSRVRYYRNATNIGGANNHNRTFELSRGKYFRLAAHDDVLTPTLLEKCVAILDQEPSVVLCYSNIIQIDEHGNQTGILNKDLACSGTPYQRFRQLANWNHDCEATYGLMRAEILRKTDLQPNYTDSDRTLLCELSLYGRFYKIAEPLFYKRYHSEMSTQAYPKIHERMAWFYPQKKVMKASAFFPSWIKTFHYLRIISRVPLNLKDRISCYLHALRWLIQAHWKSFGKEIVMFLVNFKVQVQSSKYV
jgi:glycosyltransferase involved in cell wall biosynthesis